MSIIWSQSLETGNSTIDAEHKQLIQMVNDLLAACGRGAGREKLVETANFFSTYTKTHFGHEEQLQQRHHYPKMAEHKAWHKSFTEKVGLLTEKVKKEGVSVKLVADLNLEAGLLLSHIKSMDVALAKYIHENP